jgi:FkbM family methyltransferase
MINFSYKNNKSILGRFLRLPLRLLPRNMTVRILQGELRGKKWIVGSSDHGCWLGSYEFEKQRLLTKVVKQSTVFFDIGAHVGFYTLLGSCLVKDSGIVFAFEPFPRNIEYLEKHLMANGIQNVRLFKAAVSDHTGVATFQEGPSSSMGQISERGKHAIKLASLDDLFFKGAVPLPDYLKIDVEGAEFSVLSGARQILTRGHPVIFLATHGNEAHLKCLSLLNSLGYTCHPIENTRDICSCDDLIAIKQNIKI